MQDFEEIRTRFIEIFKHFGSNYSKIGRFCGVSHTAIRDIVLGKAKSFDVSILSNLHKNSPEISILWVLTGEGEMLINQDKQETANPTEYDSENFTLNEVRLLYKKNLELEMALNKVKKERDKLRSELDQLKKKAS